MVCRLYPCEPFAQPCRLYRQLCSSVRGRVYKRYGFVDAFHPANDWTDKDVIGIDVGITLLSAENLRTGKVWKWFMRNGQIRRAMPELFT
jgi:hypothetical protein